MKYIPHALVVGSIMNVLICTRVNIEFDVNMLTRYHSNLRMDYWRDVKKF